MRQGARTPEELESLLEDAFVTRDAAALCEMFEEGAVLVAGAGAPEARGEEQIGRLAGALLEADRTYVAEPPGCAGARHRARVRKRRAQRRPAWRRRRLAIRDRAPVYWRSDPKRGGEMTQ